MKTLPGLSRKLSTKGTSQDMNNPDNTPGCWEMLACLLGTQTQLPTGASHSGTILTPLCLLTKATRRKLPAAKVVASVAETHPNFYLNLASMDVNTDLEEEKTSFQHFYEIDINAFRLYWFSDQPKCSQHICGLMSVRFCCAEDLTTPQSDSKVVYCANQVDRTQSKNNFNHMLDKIFRHGQHFQHRNWKHTAFENGGIQLGAHSKEKPSGLSWDDCTSHLFRVTRTHHLTVKLEPRGLLYVTMTLRKQWENFFMA